MIQDIYPHKFDNAYANVDPGNHDYFIYFKDNQILMYHDETLDAGLPYFKHIKTAYSFGEEDISFLFRIDDYNFFLIQKEIEVDNDKFMLYDMSKLFNIESDWMAFAIQTANQLRLWYDNHRFCGRCSSEMHKEGSERAMKCDSCGNIVYPQIAPVVMVGIRHGDKILLTEYANRVYKKKALIAGFVEIGETLEEAARREVMEEVGLKIKNLRYYKNQPWAQSSSMIVGFFADLEGSDEITLDETELGHAGWFTRAELPDNLSNISITYEMIEAFRCGEV